MSDDIHEFDHDAPPWWGNPAGIWLGILATMITGIVVNYFVTTDKTADGFTSHDAEILRLEIFKEMADTRRDVQEAFKDEAASDATFHRSMARLHASDEEIKAMIKDLAHQCKAQYHLEK